MRVNHILNDGGVTRTQELLPGQTQADLLVTHGQGNVSNLSRQRRARNTLIALSHVTAGIGPVGNIQCIEHFPTQLKPESFCDLEILVQAPVCRKHAGPAKRVAASISECGGSRLCVCGGVKPAIDCLNRSAARASSASRISDSVRPQTLAATIQGARIDGG